MRLKTKGYEAPAQTHRRWGWRAGRLGGQTLWGASASQLHLASKVAFESQLGGDKCLEEPSRRRRRARPHPARALGPLSSHRKSSYRRFARGNSRTIRVNFAQFNLARPHPAGTLEGLATRQFTPPRALSGRLNIEPEKASATAPRQSPRSGFQT